jgi:hypothetical protein
MDDIGTFDNKLPSIGEHYVEGFVRRTVDKTALVKIPNCFVFHITKLLLYSPYRIASERSSSKNSEEQKRRQNPQTTRNRKGFGLSMRSRQGHSIGMPSSWSTRSRPNIIHQLQAKAQPATVAATARQFQTP